MMKSSTVEMMRAYLAVISLAGVFIEAVVLVMLLIFRVPESFFQSAPFRVGVVAAVVAVVLVVRRLSDEAFRSALASRHAILSGTAWQTQRQTVALSPDCPRRLLVMFHVRRHRQLFDLAAP